LGDTVAAAGGQGYTAAMSSPPRKPGGPGGGRPGGAGRAGGDKPSSGRPQSPRPPGRNVESRPPQGRPPGSHSSGARPEQRGADSRPFTPHPSQTRDAESRPARTPGDRPALHLALPRPSELRHAEPERAERRPSGSRLPVRAPQPNPADTPRGTVWLYGLHAVDAALGNPNRRLRRLILTEEAEAALVARRPQPWPLTPERTERPRIDQLLGRDVVHQGAALLADPLAPPLLTQVLERPGVVLVLDQVVDPRNIGAVLRSAAAFGAACVITRDRNAPEETGALAKAASGALETVPLLRAVNLARTLVALKAAGFWTVGLDASGVPLSGPALAERRVALVLGAEGSGLRRLVRETCDEVAGLKMPGSMESLNVSAAATVALYEMARRD
jgi:23S rRNA (guanosine2251-2'-O)-methyltransferase